MRSIRVSLMVLCRKNNGTSSDLEAWRFAIYYRKLNAITQYPQFIIPVINEILANITSTYSTNFMSYLDLNSGYFQISMKPEDIVKTDFVFANGCIAFKRMSFGLVPHEFWYLIRFRMS